ncbi:chemotaxis protein CheA [Opitutaceae bacterium EW11]|nr:chemotaxis protein CheA [Opitutaceae bacterium EW11]
MNTPDPAETFLVEADDLLNQVEDTLLEVENRPDDVEAIHRLFRAFHTIKGSGAMFGFSAVSGFSHHVETVLDHVRGGRVTVTPPLIALVLAARDHIKALLAFRGAADPLHEAKSHDLENQLRVFLPDSSASTVAKNSAPAPQMSARSCGASETHYRIRFQPGPGIAATGLDPATLLTELRSLGSLSVSVDTQAVPVLSVLDPERCYVAWDLELSTAQELNRIRDVFIFVEDESVITIQPVAPQSAPDAAPVQAKTVDAPVVAGSARPSEMHAHGANTGIVRVSSEKLDRLVNLVGELVINQSRLAQVSAKIDSADLVGPVEALERLVAEMRDSVLGIRMTPIGSTFGRFKRLVHDLSHELHKKVDLVTEGGETELDKTVLDQLGDPLVHLIRNSVDHGIETPDARREAGKSATGTVRLSASHQGSHVVIEIADDGRGIDVQAVRQKAIEKKLIEPNTTLSEKDTFDLIFLPGFSTAKEVTSVSGRGVGMDVVKRQLEALRGSIEISSAGGRGTTIRLTLPLTLAIIEGLLVEVNSDQFVVPLSAVLENVEIASERDGRICAQNTVAVRGELVPYICLRDLFEIPGGRPRLEKVVIVAHNGQRVGLSVDRVIGKHQTVIQSLGRFYRDIEVASGATIMGDGRVALILDVAGLLRAQTAAIELERPTLNSSPLTHAAA